MTKNAQKFSKSYEQFAKQIVQLPTINNFTSK